MERSASAATLGSMVAIAMAVSGCVSHNRIPPTELPRLNGAYVRSGQVGNEVRAIDWSRTNVRRTDGTMLQVQGEFSATVVPRSASLPQVSFDHPVESHVTDLYLRVSGGNRPETVFPIRQVEYVDIATFDGGLTALVTVVICLVGAGAGALLAAGLVAAL